MPVREPASAFEQEDPESHGGNMITLEYTRFAVAFPRLRLSDGFDEISLSLADSEGGTHGDMKWVFHDFTQTARYPRHAVEMRVFGDGLACLFDERVQAAVAEWRDQPNPDEVTPDGLIAILERHGAVASSYMKVPR